MYQMHFVFIVWLRARLTLIDLGHDLDVVNACGIGAIDNVCTRLSCEHHSSHECYLKYLLAIKESFSNKNLETIYFGFRFIVIGLCWC